MIFFPEKMSSKKLSNLWSAKNFVNLNQVGPSRAEIAETFCPLKNRFPVSE